MNDHDLILIMQSDSAFFSDVPAVLVTFQPGSPWIPMAYQVDNACPNRALAAPPGLMKAKTQPESEPLGQDILVIS